MVSLGFESLLCLFDHFFSFAYLQAPQGCSHSRIQLPSSSPFLPPSLPPLPPPPPPPYERHTKLFLILNAPPTPPSLPPPPSPFLTSAPPTSPHPPAICPVTHDDSLLSSKNAAAAPALPSVLPSLPPSLLPGHRPAPIHPHNLARHPRRLIVIKQKRRCCSCTTLLPSLPPSLTYFLTTDLPPSTPTIWPVTQDDSLLSSKNAAAAAASSPRPNLGIGWAFAIASFIGADLVKT